MSEFVTAQGVEAFAHVFDENSLIRAEYGVKTQPSFVLIGSDGSTDGVWSAVDDVTARLDALLAG